MESCPIPSARADHAAGSEPPVRVFQKADALFTTVQRRALEGPAGPLGGFLSGTRKKMNPRVYTPDFMRLDG